MATRKKSAPAPAPVKVHSCTDYRCTLGITACVECNGFGMVNPVGKRYRKQENIPSWAVVHQACHGTGLVVCGQRDLQTEPLAEDEAATLGLVAVAA